MAKLMSSAIEPGKSDISHVSEGTKGIEHVKKFLSFGYWNAIENFRLMDFRMSALNCFYLLYANQSNLYRQSNFILLSIEATLALTTF